MKSYFQGMITGGSLMITFFVLTASQIPIAEDSGTFNTLNVETINVSKSINLNDRVFIYQNPEDDDDYRLEFFDSNGNLNLRIISNKEVSGMGLFNKEGQQLLSLGTDYENAFILFSEGESISNYIDKNSIELYDNEERKVILGFDTGNNGMIQLNNNKNINTLFLGHSTSDNGMILLNNNNNINTLFLGHGQDNGLIEIRNNSDNQTLYMGHDTNGNGMIDVNNKNGNRTQRIR